MVSAFGSESLASGSTRWGVGGMSPKGTQWDMKHRRLGSKD